MAKKVVATLRNTSGVKYAKLIRSKNQIRLEHISLRKKL